MSHNLYDDVDMRSMYNNGFWQGAALATIGMGTITLVSLYLIGAFG